MLRRLAAVLGIALAAVAGPALAIAPGGGQPGPPPPAAPVAVSLDGPGVNERVSVAGDGSQLALESDQAAVTPDGRFAAFRSGIPGAGSADRSDRILLRDRTAGTTTQLFPPAAGSAGPNIQGGTIAGPVIAEEPTISADGNLVAFTVTSGRLPTPRIVLWRRDSGLSAPLSDPNLAAENVAGSVFGRVGSLHPRLSADGSVLVFLSQPLGESTTPQAGFYALVFATKTIEAVSARTGQTSALPGQAEFGTAAVSADGNLVAFSSSQDFEFVPILSEYVSIYSAVNTDSFLVLPSPGMYASPEGGTYEGNSDGSVVYVPRPRQIWLRNRLARTTTLVSAIPAVPGAAADTPGGGNSDHPAVSADGAVIAFDSDAPDLVPGDGNGATDVFERVGGGPIVRVSVPPAGGEGNGASSWPAVSTDGRLVAFASQATNLVPGDTNQASDIFLAGPEPDRLARESVGIGPGQADGPSQRPSLAANGDLVFFDSAAANLVAGDSNGAGDVFVRIRQRPPPERIPAIAANPRPVDFGVIVLGGLKDALRTVSVSSVGTGPLSISGISLSGPDAGDFLPVVDTCSGRTLAPGAGCSIAILFVVATPPARAATLLIANNSKANPFPVPLRAERARQPRLELRPPSGPPGTVVIARGTGFPRNYPVAFAWSRGLTPIPLTVTVADEDGAFTAQVLVLPNDRLGPRSLRANVDLAGFVPPTAPFLVTRPNAIPPKIEPTDSFRSPIIRVLVLQR